MFIHAYESFVRLGYNNELTVIKNLSETATINRAYLHAHFSGKCLRDNFTVINEAPTIIIPIDGLIALTSQ